MTDLLENKVRRSFWGYIYLDRNGELEHTLIESSSGIVRLLRRFYEANLTMHILEYSVRKNLPYLGMISWRHIDGVMRLYGLLTASDITPTQHIILHEELIKIAKIKRASKIVTQTLVPQKIMNRRGWQYHGPAGNSGQNIYELPIENESYQEAISVFEKIRDIPYQLGQGGAPESLFEDNYGECTRKNLKLAQELIKRGHTIDMFVYEFDWRDLPVPEHIKNLLKRPNQHHTTVYVRDLDVELDATFPLNMVKLGFKANNWDGETSTPISVKPLSDPRRINYHLFLAQYKASQIIKTLRYWISPPNTPFNNAFNEWVATNT